MNFKKMFDLFFWDVIGTFMKYLKKYLENNTENGTCWKIIFNVKSIFKERF